MFPWKPWRALCLLPALAQAAPTATKILDNGPDDKKFVIVVFSEGYTAADMPDFRKDVDEVFRDGVFKKDFYRDYQNGFNLYRVETESQESGIGSVTYDLKGTPADKSDDVLDASKTVTKNTYFGVQSNGVNSHCWYEIKQGAKNKMDDLADDLVPDADFMVLISNANIGHGCASGNKIWTDKGSTASTMAHELGHTFGLADEYTAAMTYTSSTWSGGVNCTLEKTRSDIYWKRFIDPATPTPTTLSAAMDPNLTVGAFEGCSRYDKGIYRPVDNCRMKGNSPRFCPVCHTHIMGQLVDEVDYRLSNIKVGDFNGDGKHDLISDRNNDIRILAARKDGGGFQEMWTGNNTIEPEDGDQAAWMPRSGDVYEPADFSGDDTSDVYIMNGIDWSGEYYLGMLRSTGKSLETVKRYHDKIGDWTMKRHDRLYVGDFDGDNKTDLILFNGEDWDEPRLGLFKSEGKSLDYLRTYKGDVGSWEMKAGDIFRVGDFDEDGKADLYVFNGSNWGTQPRLGMLKSTGTALSFVRKYVDEVDGWDFGPSDRLIIGDFDEDGKKDLYIWNRDDQDFVKVGMLRSKGTSMETIRQYDGGSGGFSNISGYSLKKRDVLLGGDADKNGKADLFVYNETDWDKPRLGVLKSNGTALSGDYVEDEVDGWSLTFGTMMFTMNGDDASGRNSVFFHDDIRWGLLRYTGSTFKLDASYQKWVFNPEYDANPRSTGFPQ